MNWDHDAGGDDEGHAEWSAGEVEHMTAGPRLVFAGVVSLALLGWLVLARLGAQTVWVIGCVTGALTVLVTLLPILLFGLKSDRWLAVLLAIFPIALLQLLWIAPFLF